MKTVLPIMFSLFCVSVSAQQTALRGVVAVFNSKFETGKTEYVANAQVEEAYERATPTLSASDGSFKLVLVGIKEKTSFGFNVRKNGYEVVNSDQLRAVAGQRDAVRIFMAPKGKIAENKRKYYNIGKTASERALDEKIAAKQAEVRALRADQTANRQKIRDAELEIADLYQRYQTIDQNARQLAERFATVNLDDASDLYQRAFRHFQNGFIDSALIVLEEVDWEARVDSILAEEARLFALKNVIDYNDSVLLRHRDSIAKAIGIKIESHRQLRQYGEALRSAGWLLRLYTQDTSSRLTDRYRQIAWLALQAQEYSLANLYAQTGLELTRGEDRQLQRYVAYTLFFNGETEQSRRLFRQLRETSGNAAVFRDEVLRDLEQLEYAGLPGADIEAFKRLAE